MSLILLVGINGSKPAASQASVISILSDDLPVFSSLKMMPLNSYSIALMKKIYEVLTYNNHEEIDI